MAAKVPFVTFKNGYKAPIIGLGTWKSKPGEVETAVKVALDCGYRHLDCAKAYENEAEIGNALSAKMEDGTVKREDLFITTKLWLTHCKKDLVVPALKKQLKDLGLSYVDLYLIHWPVSLKHVEGEIFPTDEEGNMILEKDSDYLDTWRGMELCVKEGLARSIGLSNFNRRQVERVVKEAEIHPATNQIECHPYLSQKKLIHYCKKADVTITSYSPLGSPDRPILDNNPELLEDPTVLSLAKKYKKDAGQILIRYHIQNDNIVIPKSITPSRIKSNFEVFDFEISSEDMKTLEDLNKDLRYIGFTPISKHPQYPFNDEY